MQLPSRESLLWVQDADPLKNPSYEIVLDWAQIGPPPTSNDMPRLLVAQEVRPRQSGELIKGDAEEIGKTAVEKLVEQKIV